MLDSSSPNVSNSAQVNGCKNKSNTLESVERLKWVNERAKWKRARTFRCFYTFNGIDLFGTHFYAAIFFLFGMAGCLFLNRAFFSLSLMFTLFLYSQIVLRMRVCFFFFLFSMPFLLRVPFKKFLFVRAASLNRFIVFLLRFGKRKMFYEFNTFILFAFFSRLLCFFFSLFSLRCENFGVAAFILRQNRSKYCTLLVSNAMAVFVSVSLDFLVARCRYAILAEIREFWNVSMVGVAVQKLRKRAKTNLEFRIIYEPYNRYVTNGTNGTKGFLASIPLMIWNRMLP